jgi:hypothetical protein
MQVAVEAYRHHTVKTDRNAAVARELWKNSSDVVKGLELFLTSVLEVLHHN